jgi:hypothetical protein
MAAFLALRPILKKLSAYFQVISLKHSGSGLGTDFALDRWLGERLESKDAGSHFTLANYLIGEEINFHGGSVDLPRLFQGGCE